MRDIKLVYFSPTGTTKAVVQAIANGIDSSKVEFIDITKPEARRQELKTSENELLIIGVPVYMGRVPALLEEWFNALKADNTPAICVVVYGNRAYEDALLELKDIIKERGGLPIAGAAYIGEHSFSNSETPSIGRPDRDDLDHAAAFGVSIRKKLHAAKEIQEVEVPGTHPYGGITELWDVDFIAVNDDCKQCGACAELCPVDAIDPQNSSVIDKDKCITCCACLKKCPQHAREMKPGPVKDAQGRINTLFVDRKAPECFL
ncbi:EFR1 family ferrodoxin [Pseudodesulfovibrio sp. zrk46]|uniref:EFR1 family ferrodoxin n=1 Tax=Pseudodesulfovibrio sp. zrk46 TaxID=2725288 RepID=UPI001FFDC919|nr:EFR1 family ferrodoxin [Pseudodesulfovibrio sp. zrk46]